MRRFLGIKVFIFSLAMGVSVLNAAGVDLSMLTPEQAAMYQQYKEKSNSLTPKNKIYSKESTKIVNKFPGSTSSKQTQDMQTQSVEENTTSSQNPFLSSKTDVLSKEMYDAINKKVLEEKKLYKNPFIYVQNSKRLEDLKDAAIKKDEPKKLQRFSKSFFLNKNALDSASLPIAAYYVLVPGDKISVILTGRKNASYTLVVDRNGKINVPSVGSIKVASLEYKEAKKRITNFLQKAFSNTDVALDIVDFSAIQVMVTGDVAYPGLYNLSSFSTIRDALIASKGVNDFGSVRNVVLKRNHTTIAHFDLYKLISFANTKEDRLLRNGDVIYIQKANTIVTLKGDVVNPAMYEVKSTETYKDILTISSGIRFDANRQNIRLTRYIHNTSAEIRTLRLHDLSKLKPRDGDVVEVFALQALDVKQVSIYGNVAVKGAMQLRKDTTLYSVLTQSKNFLLKDTYYDIALIKHKSIDNLPKIEEVNLHDILDKKTDIALQDQDEVYIFNRYEVQENPYIRVKGDVLKEQTKYQFYKGMTVNNLFKITHFINENNETKEMVKVDVHNVEVSRLTPKGMQQYTIDLTTNKNFVLKSYDTVTFYDYYRSHTKKEVHIYGLVYREGDYAFTKGMTVASLLALSGGAQPEAYLKKVELVRYALKNGVRSRKVQTLDLTKDTATVSLQNEDELYIRKIPLWEKSRFVTIKGEVKFPGKYQIAKDESLANVIKRAGGYLDSAFLDGAVFTRNSVQALQILELNKSLEELALKTSFIAASQDSKTDKMVMLKYIEALTNKAKSFTPIGRITVKLNKDMKAFESSAYNISLEQNDTLYIPKARQTIVLVGEVLSPNAVVYEKGLKVANYIEKVGGYKTSADKDNIFVIKADGSYKRYVDGWLWDFNDHVDRGDIIVVAKKLATQSTIKSVNSIVDIGYKLAISLASLNTLGLFQ